MWSLYRRIRGVLALARPASIVNLVVAVVLIVLSVVLSWFVVIYPLAAKSNLLTPGTRVQIQTPEASSSPMASSSLVTATITAASTPIATVGSTPIAASRPTPRYIVPTPTPTPAPTPTPTPVSIRGTIVDNLNDWSKTYSHTANLDFDANNSQVMGGDTSLAVRPGSTSTHEAIVWRQTGISSFSAKTYFWPGEAVSAFSVLISTDGTNWTTVLPMITTPGVDNWTVYTYTLNSLANVNYVKMIWNNTQGNPWSPQVGQVTIGYSYTR